MNRHDSEKISGLLSELGYSPCSSEFRADLILLNTCSVREKAYQKVYSYLGKLKPLKKANPSLIIGVCGCVAQQEKENLFRRAPFINFLMGPRSLGNLKHLIEESCLDHQSKDLEFRNDFLHLSHQKVMRKTFPKAYLTIMEGCNRRCSYCIVPQTRGREAYRPFQDIISEARYLTQIGFLEIELLGQNVNSYHCLDKSFHDLLRELSKIEKLKRIRFTTSHPAQLDMRIMLEMKSNEKICNHLHLPVQSGSNKILHLMNRGYVVEDFISKALWLKKNIKGFTLSTDIIVGFPGECEKDFQETLSLLDTIEFDQLYSFAYSPRPHTSAMVLDDDVPRSLKLDRLHRIQQKQNKIQKQLNEKWIGKIIEVLIDGHSPKDHSWLCGRTTNNKIVHFKDETSSLSVGQFQNIQITQSSVHALIGKIPR